MTYFRNGTPNFCFNVAWTSISVRIPNPSALSAAATRATAPSYGSRSRAENWSTCAVFAIVLPPIRRASRHDVDDRQQAARFHVVVRRMVQHVAVQGPLPGVVRHELHIVTFPGCDWQRILGELRRRGQQLSLGVPRHSLPRRADCRGPRLARSLLATASSTALLKARRISVRAVRR